MTKFGQWHIWLLFSFLMIAASLAILALLTPANTASAQDATRVDLPEVAIPLAKCTGSPDACFNVDQSKVEDGSCNGYQACYHNSPYTGTIGAGSCNGDYACLAAGGPIGAGACNGLSACQEAAGSIGAGACNGAFACALAADSIGAGSCGGYYACYVAGGVIGNNSCNTTTPSCGTGGSFPVGDCENNTRWVAACGCQPTTVTTYTPIPDNNPSGICVSIPYSGTGTVATMSLRTAMSHTYSGDLKLWLVNPASQSLVLMNRPGFPGTFLGTSANLTATYPITFTDTATQSAESMGTGVLSSQNVCQQNGVCAFAPNQDGSPSTFSNFSGFVGQSASGTWQFCASDNVGIDVGAVFTVTLSITCEPYRASLPLVMR